MNSSKMQHLKIKCRTLQVVSSECSLYLQQAEAVAAHAAFKLIYCLYILTLPVPNVLPKQTDTASLGHSSAPNATPGFSTPYPPRNRPLNSTTARNETK